MSTQKNEHNPDNLTPEQYGAPEWRLLREDELQDSSDEYWCISEQSWTENLPCDHGCPVTNDPITYRRRITPPTDTTGSGREGETVETDAFEPKHQISIHHWADFARKLERQRDAALAVIRQTALDTADPSDDLETKRRIIHKRCRAAIDSAQRQEGR